MTMGLLAANSYRDLEKVLQIETTVQQLLALALRPGTLRLTARDQESNRTFVTEGTYRGCNWCRTDDGLACVLRLTPLDGEWDSAIDVSKIEHVEPVAADTLAGRTY